MATPASARKETVVSAPGKVLIAGGYLVLDPAYPGLVISTSSRFYTVVRTRDGESSGRFPVRVLSPQFVGAEWEFIVSIQGEEAKLVQTGETYTSPHAGPNPFLSLSILYALRLAKETRGPDALAASLSPGGLDIYVLADNDFYSQRSSSGAAPSTSELQSIPPFQSQGKPIKDVHKTGLGSSAAMTTSLVGSLLIHLGAVPIAPDGSLPSESLALIHNTAQLAHCAAQGKVGSGFDVSAAVWGSHLFRRFDKDVIQGILDRGERVAVEGSPEAETSGSSETLWPALQPSNPLWHPSPLSSGQVGETHPTAVEGLAASISDNPKVARPAPMALPPRFEMVLADVDAGSNTPSLVGKVTEWKKSKPEWAKQLYRILASANQTLADTLFSLTLAYGQDPGAYDEAVELAASKKSKEWDALAKEKPSSVLKLLIETRNAMRSVQGGMRELGRQAGAPVEPNEMGDVIKASIDGSEGIVGGGVPGAGGYDAMFLLYLRPPSVANGFAPGRAKVEQLWSEWTALSVGPLLCSAGGSASVSTAALEQQAKMLSQAHGGQPSGAAPAVAAPTNDGGLRLVSVDEVKRLKDALER